MCIRDRTKALRLEFDDREEPVIEVAPPEDELRDIDFFKNLDQ